MSGSKDCTEACPTPTAHRRLSEGHRWWHGCVDNYDDPPSFQANLNACLQALRNVTFVLQKERRLVPEFGAWYPGWQERFKSDDRMRWVVKSRNRIVKSGDLELLSAARIRFVASYADIASTVADGLSPTTIPEVKGKSIPPRTRPSEYPHWIPARVAENASILVERQWVDRALPDEEILDALAHCYGELSALLKSAHERSGVQYTAPGCTGGGSSVSVETIEQHGERLPCMITTLDTRTAQYRVSDGSLVFGEYRSVALPKSRVVARRMRKYGAEQLAADLVTTPASLVGLVGPLFEQAKRILREDKHHIFVVLFCRGVEIIRSEAGVMEDRAFKFAYSREIARKVAVLGVDGVITIGEVWSSCPVLDEDGVMIPPAEVADRREAIQVSAEDRYGNKLTRSCFFRKRFNRIVFEEEFEISGEMENNFMAPVRAVWKSWDE
ncbi:hypothetical protein AB0H34_31495 [Saccharopolyspora shandongensis]|uniref:hypothetical protein n=1 Tax=Saccharopolyspora shandongensis TaxID=418495 RepID=UPI0033C166AA